MLSWHAVFSVIKACAAAPTCVPHSLQHGHQVYVVPTYFMGQTENIILDEGEPIPVLLWADMLSAACWLLLNKGKRSRWEGKRRSPTDHKQQHSTSISISIIHPPFSSTFHTITILHLLWVKGLNIVFWQQNCTVLNQNSTTLRVASLVSCGFWSSKRRKNSEDIRAATCQDLLRSWQSS